MVGSPGDVSEEPVTYEKRKKDWRMSCDVGEAELILQSFRHFTYVTAHSPTLPSLYLRHSSFCNHSVASPTSQLILQPLFRFSYVTGSSLTSPGEPPMAVAKMLKESPHCTWVGKFDSRSCKYFLILFIGKHFFLLCSYFFPEKI